MTSCSVEGCTRPRKSRGWCNTHYERWRVHGDPTSSLWTKTCTVDGCSAPHHGRGLCQMHYYRWHRTDDARAADVARVRQHAEGAQCVECGAPRTKVDKCDRCYRRIHMRENGAAAASLRRARERAAVCAHGPKCVTVKVRCTLLASPCVYCSAPAAHVDHFEPLARGGKHCRDNLAAACADCNTRKWARDPWQWWALRAEVAS